MVTSFAFVETFCLKKIISVKLGKQFFFICFASCINLLIQQAEEMILNGTCCTSPSERELCDGHIFVVNDLDRDYIPAP